MSRGRRRLANHAWEALLRAHAALMKEFAAEDIWRELSMREYDVLYTLAKCREPIRLGELHRHVLLSQPALSRMVDRLVARGLVRPAPPTRPTAAGCCCRSPRLGGHAAPGGPAARPRTWRRRDDPAP